ncbi:MAG: hypothetical protein A3G32_04575 [Deltaproteobacteria bacterium RIFCSPLOWO2_12_FULL_40_28]|nr:MAG: hypothetical protein A3C45_08685 [Deltaproteobacteria bacterium RIFCSPHIGHO2_02_FULL_40_28]OGQ19645.1 MAG: hypothetical protein A3E27_07880 [Deltaproteobacteria bacterium RIFCSPHIGHO2_12_FULL_40_32]OGQ40922.1 MAG: hypothetical protein A3I69_03295 [Deltaproteobacteria bacterium RIFCSPLOWO2_02_FULL_40_36]OGQ54037.1 MAG: hypothetical protein A3G32_04575 [Deltaproteobacteria bacterium RIFCSPLOWO2_12_FULL_40_28]
MLKTLEATIERDGTVRLKEPMKPQKPCRALVTILDEYPQISTDALFSEKALAEGWLNPEEDKAWIHLQKAQ